MNPSFLFLNQELLNQKIPGLAFYVTKDHFLFKYFLFLCGKVETGKGCGVCFFNYDERWAKYFMGLMHSGIPDFFIIMFIRPLPAWVVMFQLC